MKSNKVQSSLDYASKLFSLASKLQRDQTVGCFRLPRYYVQQKCYVELAIFVKEDDHCICARILDSDGIKEIEHQFTKNPEELIKILKKYKAEGALKAGEDYLRETAKKESKGSMPANLHRSSVKITLPELNGRTVGMNPIGEDLVDLACAILKLNCC